VVETKKSEKFSVQFFNPEWERTKTIRNERGILKRASFRLKRMDSVGFRHFILDLNEDRLGSKKRGATLRWVTPRLPDRLTTGQVETRGPV
jgi:hypothetical protein